MNVNTVRRLIIGGASAAILATSAPAFAHEVYDFNPELWRSNEKCLGGKSQVNGYLQTQAIAYGFKDQTIHTDTQRCYASWDPGIDKLKVKTKLQIATSGGGFDLCRELPWKFNNSGGYVVIQQNDFGTACGYGTYRTRTEVGVHYNGAWHESFLFSGTHTGGSSTSGGGGGGGAW